MNEDAQVLVPVGWLREYLLCLRDDLDRMEDGEPEHYTDADRQAMRDRIQEVTEAIPA